jgi:hypothetical protein
LLYISISPCLDHGSHLDKSLVSRIWMLVDYRSPHARVVDIAVFAGPALYRELSLVDKTSFDLLKSARGLKESLGLAGWTSEVLESLETHWLVKMVMIESCWSMQPLLSSFPCALWRFRSIRVGDYFFNPDISDVADARVADLLSMQANSPVFLALAINTWYYDSGKRLCVVWNLLFSANEIPFYARSMEYIYKILISDPRRDS